MRAYTFIEHIDRTPQQVWNALVDLERAPRWRPLVRSMETEDGQPLREGSRVRITIEFHGRRESRTSTVVAFEPPRRWTFHSSDNPAMEGVFDFVLDSEAGGTRVTATCDIEAHRILPWLFLPLIARGERQRRIEMLPNLKRFVESQP